MQCKYSWVFKGQLIAGLKDLKGLFPSLWSYDSVMLGLWCDLGMKASQCEEIAQINKFFFFPIELSAWKF